MESLSKEMFQQALERATMARKARLDVVDTRSGNEVRNEPGELHVKDFDYDSMDLNRRDCFDAIAYKTPHYFFTCSPRSPGKTITPAYVAQNKFAEKIEFTSVLPPKNLPAGIQYVFHSRYTSIDNDKLVWNFERKGFDFYGSIERDRISCFGRAMWAWLRSTHFPDPGLNPLIIEKALEMIGIISEGMIEGKGLSMRMYPLFDKLENGEGVEEKLFEPFTC
jgi:hypothetical protein